MKQRGGEPQATQVASNASHLPQWLTFPGTMPSTRILFPHCLSGKAPKWAGKKLTATFPSTLKSKARSVRRVNRNEEAKVYDGGKPTGNPLSYSAAVHLAGRCHMTSIFCYQSLAFKGNLHFNLLAKQIWLFLSGYHWHKQAIKYLFKRPKYSGMESVPEKGGATSSDIKPDHFPFPTTF